MDAEVLARSRQAPTRGCLRSVQPSFLRVVFPLRLLQLVQAVTMFSQVNLPPLLAGFTWSSVRFVLAPQYLSVRALHAIVRVVLVPPASRDRYVRPRTAVPGMWKGGQVSSVLRGVGITCKHRRT